ncbi:MAG: PKD domain-containing protein, partial [Desulfovibrionales bacterium]|nr:PKD domain-containing protein [Desulfovibrionales bacterium]
YRIKHPDGRFSPAEGYYDKEVTNIGEQTLAFDHTEIGIYDLILYCTDQAGNKSAEILQKIRMNAPPTIQVGNPRSVYQGRILTLDQSDFLCTDTDGTVEVYNWNFGDSDKVYISSEPSISHIYSETGEYTVTLTASDNDGGETTATLTVTVTTTLAGELALDEVWTGRIELEGGISVPAGITLTIKAGTEIIVPLDAGINVAGKILSGEVGDKVKFTVESPGGKVGPGLWQGIYLSAESVGSAFINTQIEYATRGLILNTQNIVIADSIFRNNEIGIHMAQSSITIQKCSFDNNLLYGIKEEGNCTPIINDNIFTGNGLAPYYHYQETILTVEEVNKLLGSGNQ